MIKSLLLATTFAVSSGAGSLQKNDPIFQKQTPLQTEKNKITDSSTDDRLMITLPQSFRNTEIQPQNFSTTDYPNNYGAYATGETNNISIGNVGSIKEEYRWLSFFGMRQYNDGYYTKTEAYYITYSITIITINPWKQWNGQYTLRQYGLQANSLYYSYPREYNQYNYIYISENADFSNIQQVYNNPYTTYQLLQTIQTNPNKTPCNVALTKYEIPNIQTFNITQNITTYGSMTQYNGNSTEVNGTLPLEIKTQYLILINQQELLCGNWGENYYQNYNDLTKYDQDILWRFNKPYDQNVGNIYYGHLPTPTINNYEVIDIPDLMFTVLTLPFTFVSKAFDLTLFPGTNYEVNIAGLLFALLGALLIVFIVKKLKP